MCPESVCFSQADDWIWECHCNLVEVLGCIGMNQNWLVNFPPSYIPFGEPTLPSTSSRTKSQHWVQCSSPTAFRKHPLHTRSSLYLFMSVFYTTHICSLNPASLGKLAYSTNFHKVAGSHEGLLFCTWNQKVSLWRSTSHAMTRANPTLLLSFALLGSGFMTTGMCGVCMCVRVIWQLQVLLHPQDLSLTGNSPG